MNTNKLNYQNRKILSRRRFDDACDIINQPIMYLMSLGFCIVQIDCDADDEKYYIEMCNRSCDGPNNFERHYARFDIWSEGGELIIFEMKENWAMKISLR